MLAAYRSVATQGGVDAADPHRLIVMLIDGALERIAQARGCAQRNEKADKSAHVQRALAIIGELRASLDLSRGEIAANLDALYDYMARQLLRAHVEEGSECLDRVAGLLHEIRSAWIALPAEARSARRETR